MSQDDHVTYWVTACALTVAIAGIGLGLAFWAILIGIGAVGLAAAIALLTG